MSRRGRGGTQISLFAFQDIITSVTAILIVLVLFLSLELINAKEAKRKTPSEEVHPDKSAQVQELRSKLQELQNAPRLDPAELQELGNNTPASMTVALRVAIERRETLQKKLAELEEQLRQAENRAGDAKQKFDAEKSNVELTQSLESEVAELRTLIESSTDREQLWFSLPVGFEGEGWIVVVGEKSLSLARIREEMRPITMQSEGLFGVDLANPLLRWIRKESRTDEYFLILIRPDGANAADEITKQLKSNSINFGFDVVSDSEEVLDPEMGVRLK